MGLATEIMERDGRFQWGIAVGEGRRKRLDVSVVTFATPQLAELDLHVHLNAERDHAGKTIVPLEHIDRLIAAFVEQTPTCAGLQFGGATWHAPDDTNYNWEVRYVNGDSAAFGDCMTAMRPHIDRLRQLYSAPNPW